MSILAAISLLFSLTLSSATPLIFTALGGAINENSGVTNIGLEGLMTAGAWSGVVVALWTQNPWLAFLCAGLGAMIFAALYAFATVYLRADQIIAGIAINFLAPGTVIFLNRLIFDGSVSTPSIPLEHKMPRPLSQFFTNNATSVLSNFVNFYAVVYIAFLVTLIVWFILYHTRLGLHVRATGEHPEATQTVGIDVYRVRFFSLLFSGFLVGLGGASITLAVVSGFRPSVISGQGFIALAAIIFGQWHPIGILMSCLLFGFLSALSVFLGSAIFSLDISPHLLATLPYIASLFVLVFVTKKARGPASLGKPYVRS
ncbi:MAG: ABC transporter permease [Spirochaetia bacterium]